MHLDRTHIIDMKMISNKILSTTLAIIIYPNLLPVHFKQFLKLYFNLAQNKMDLKSGNNKISTLWRSVPDKKNIITLEQGNLTLINLEFQYTKDSALIPQGDLIATVNANPLSHIYIKDCIFQSIQSDRQSTLLSIFNVITVELQNCIFNGIGLQSQTIGFGQDAYLELHDPSYKWTYDTVSTLIRDMFNRSFSDGRNGSVYFEILQGDTLQDKICGNISLSDQTSGKKWYHNKYIIIGGSVGIVILIVVIVIIICCVYCRKRRATYSSKGQEKDPLIPHTQ
ncbi:MAG: hypothetical protein EZS28_015280, partial [Streblomastix strix]